MWTARKITKRGKDNKWQIEKNDNYRHQVGKQQGKERKRQQRYRWNSTKMLESINNNNMERKNNNINNKNNNLERNKDNNNNKHNTIGKVWLETHRRDWPGLDRGREERSRRASESQIFFPWLLFATNHPVCL